jgi:hypothetical protein
MIKRVAASAVVASLALPALAVQTGDIFFTSANFDEKGFSFVTFADLAAGTTIFFNDNEWGGSSFNTGEGVLTWSSGSSTIAAGTVVRLTSVQTTSIAASVGTVARSGSFDIAAGSSGDVLYAYTGSSSAPTFLAAITNSAFNNTNGSLNSTGLVEGVTALDLNGAATSPTPDYAVYAGERSGATSFATYKSLLGSMANWTVDSVDGVYTTTVPDTTAFSVTAVPEPGTYAMLLAGLASLGFLARRRRA